MPIYEYKCRLCGQFFEKLVFNSDEKVSCPKCKADDVDKQVSGFSVGNGSPNFQSPGLTSGGCGGGGGFS